MHEEGENKGQIADGNVGEGDTVALDQNTQADVAETDNTQNTGGIPAVGKPKKKEGRGPGRPKKAVPTIPVEVYGIVEQPANPDDVLELVYCNPILFKKIFQLYKSFGSSEIEIIFNHSSVRIEAKDHYKKSTIYSIIDGRCMNLYYCKFPIRICVNRNNIEKAIGALNKNHYKITFVLKEENYRSTMYMVIKDLEYNNDDSYEIGVVFKPENPADGAMKDDDSNYPIKFRVSSKHFKSKINNIRKLSPTFTVQKCGNDPLQFTFDRAQIVNWTGVYNDAAKIDLKSSLAPDDIFNVSVTIDYIKPFANSVIGDEVYISADKRKRMSFTSVLDRKDTSFAALVKVFTDIKDYRETAKSDDGEII